MIFLVDPDLPELNKVIKQINSGVDISLNTPEMVCFSFQILFFFLFVLFFSKKKKESKSF